MNSTNDNEPLITDAEFEVIEGPYRPVEPDPYERLPWWKKAIAEGAGLAVYIGGFILLVIVATWAANAFWGGYDRAAHAVIETVQ